VAVTRCIVVLTAALALGCSKQPPSPPPAPSSAQSPQTFDFAAQAVAFSPPPAPWEAEAELSGGIRGVRYVKRRSVGEAIGVGNYYDVSRRLRGAQIARLLDTDSNIRNLSFDQAMRDAWCATENPYSDLEAEVAAKVNAALNRVVAARRQGDYENVRRELITAQEDAERLHFTFDEVIERALFDPDASSDPARYRFVKRADTTIAGRPGIVLDYMLELREGRRYLRKAYVMHNDHLFVADFIGLETSLAEFDRVVASLSFPP